ncbi:MAG: ABC transporter ATP-binding protein [Lachnospiraceae bacterium]|nr:MAG: ABC transporter ATP-binding protein [Lachnospiraceae bacterium]
MNKMTDTNQTPKNENKKEDFKRLSAYALMFKSNLFAGLLLLLTAVAFELLAPFSIRKILDEELIKSPINQSSILKLVSFYLLYNITASLFKYVSSIQLKIMALKIVKKMRLQIFEKLQQLDVSFFDNMPAGSIVSKITNDTEAVQSLYVKVLGELVKGTVYIIGVYIMFFRLNFNFALISLLLIPLLLFTIWFYNEKARKYNDIIRSKISVLNGILNEAVQGISIIRSFNNTKSIKEEFDEANIKKQDERYKLLILNSLTSYTIIGAFKNIVFTVMIYYFGSSLLKNISITSIGLLYIYVDYIDVLFHNIHVIVGELANLSKSAVASSHIFEMIDKVGTPISNETIAPILGNVEFKDVSFYYKNEEYVLKNINLIAQKGQVVALVGHTGSGKSSIMNLLLKFYEPQKGDILIDGMNLKDLKNQAIRNQMGIVLQDPYIFSDTLFYNIALGNPNIGKRDALKALEMVGATDILESNAMDEKILDHGSMLSSGQRQLISFARALAQNPKILILDEATSSIDSQTEEIIQNAMSILMKGRTTFIIAHRLSTIKNADKIYLLDKGRIVEEGNHETLIQKKGKYYEMYQAQNID